MENQALPSFNLSLGWGFKGWHCGWGAEKWYKFGKFSHSGRVMGKLCVADDLLCVHSCKLGSANFCGCMVDGMIDRAAS